MKAPLVLALALPLVLATSSSFAAHGHGGGHAYGGRGGPVRVVVGPRYGRPYVPFVSSAIGFGLGYGAGVYAGYPYSWRDPYPSRPVVVEHRTIIEHDHDADDVITYQNRAPEHSLLRDLQGRCFERSYENGRETRVELDPSECNF